MQRSPRVRQFTTHTMAEQLGKCPPIDDQDTQPLPLDHSLKNDAPSAHLRTVRWLLLPIYKSLNRPLRPIPCLFVSTALEPADRPYFTYKVVGFLLVADPLFGLVLLTSGWGRVVPACTTHSTNICRTMSSPVKSWAHQKDAK